MIHPVHASVAKGELIKILLHVLREFLACATKTRKNSVAHASAIPPLLGGMMVMTTTMMKMMRDAGFRLGM